MIDYLFALLDWCKVQTLLWKKGKPILFKEGEIWWCSVGINVGVEIYGKGKHFTRPILILKKFDADSFFALPLTTKRKVGTWYASVRYSGTEARAVLSQGRTLDAKRLLERIGTLTDDNFYLIKQAFLDFYGL